MRPGVTSKLVTTCIHLFDYCSPGRCDVDGTLAVIDASDEEGGLCAT